MPLGSAVLVPLTNPASAEGLIAHAVPLATPDDGLVLPVTVVTPDASPAVRSDATALVQAAEAAVAERGARSHGLVIEDADIASGVLRAAEEHAVTLVLMGWRGRSTNRNVFGELIDTIVGRSRTPMAVVRLGAAPTRRVLLPLSDDHLSPAGAGGVRLAAQLTRRLADNGPRSIRLLRTEAGAQPLPPVVAQLADRVHHDPRRYALAVGAAAEAEDLVVVPVAPTVSGLRTATTHVAWRAPEATLVVAIDVGPQPDVDASTQAAGQPAPAELVAAQRPVTERSVVVTARLSLVASAPRDELGVALGQAGHVADVEMSEDAEGFRCLRAVVRVPAESSNDALAFVMTALHEAPGFRGAELRYEVEEIGGG